MSEKTPRGVEDSIFGETAETDGFFNGIIWVGGMTTYDEERMAMAYKAAAEMLVEAARDSGDRSWEVTAPILYLYRHTLELYLKWVVQPEKRNHNLPALIDSANKIALQKTGDSLPKWALDRMHEFASFDASSTAFRYAGCDAPEHFLESAVDLYHLRQVMECLTSGLEKLARM